MERRQVRKAVLILTAFALFILCIQAIKAGAQVPDALLDRLERPRQALGVAWLGAYLALSGSPVAAVAITLHANHVIPALTSFAMVAGSRLGAEAIVLVAGALAILRGRDEATKRGLEVGFLAFLVSMTVYIPATLMGWFVLVNFSPTFSLPFGGTVASVTDYTTRPAVRALVELVGPAWTTLIGILGIWAAFRLFEKNLPSMKESRPYGRAIKRMFLRPSRTFLLGAIVTFFATTVSISMTLLVPLHMRGLVTRGQLAAYMLGAGITTLVDTYFAAVVAGDPGGEVVVLVLAACVTLVSLLCLIFFKRVVHLWSRALDTITSSVAHMVVAALALLLAPLVLALS